MKISRLRINDRVTTKGDFLDLILELQNIKTDSIVVMRTVDGSITKGRDFRDEYRRNNQGQWYLIKSKGKTVNYKIRVAKENKQFMIEYI